MRLVVSTAFAIAMLGATGLVGYMAISPASRIAAVRAASAGAPASETRVLPFFFALGEWPGALDGEEPVLELPYQKGPPTRFLGKIILRWPRAGAEWTFEGPKTPPRRDPRSFIEGCFVESAGMFRGWPGCWLARTASLERGLAEVKRHGVAPKTLEWWTVEHPKLSADERTRVLRVAGAEIDEKVDSFTLISPSGSHQTVTFKRRSDLPWVPEDFLKSLRVSDGLDPGRAWIDQRISGIRLADSAPDPARLAEVQKTLVAKISVNPDELSAYYHLAGTALLDLRSARAQTNTARADAAAALLESAVRFAHDVAVDASLGDQGRLREMDSMLKEARQR